MIRTMIFIIVLINFIACNPENPENQEGDLDSTSMSTDMNAGSSTADDDGTQPTAGDTDTGDTGNAGDTSDTEEDPVERNLNCEEIPSWYGESPPIAETPNITTADGQILRMNWDDYERYYAIALPENYNPDIPAPMIIHFHGGNNTIQGTVMKRQWLIDRARAEGFIYVIPQGLAKVWNATHCCGAPFYCDEDDVGAVEAMVNVLGSSIAVDLDRVYATGHSNGGMFSHRIAVELPNLFAAVAPGASSIGGKPKNSLTDEIIRLEPTNNPIPILLYHGKRDGSVKFGGGVSGPPEEQTPNSRIDLSFDESTAYWLEANGCSDNPTTTREGSATIKEYTCSEAPVTTLVFNELGHSYPDPDDVTDFDFGEILFRFFNTHRRGE